jgi:hypothetical protein
MMKTKMVAALVLGLGVVAMAPNARAEDPGRGDYAYKFDDDKLLGKDIAGNTPVIVDRSKGRRNILHRPRVQFVQEMLKSVENM